MQIKWVHTNQVLPHFVHPAFLHIFMWGCGPCWSFVDVGDKQDSALNFATLYHHDDRISAFLTMLCLTFPQVKVLK